MVDASSDNLTRSLRESQGVEYLRNQTGVGRMTTSRNIGLLSAIGDIIVFVDDDAFASDTWLAELLRPYDEPAVGEMGRRVLQRKDAAGLGPAKGGPPATPGELYASCEAIRDACSR